MQFLSNGLAFSSQIGVTIAVLALVSHYSLNASTFLGNLAILVGTINSAIMRLDVDI